MGQDVPAFPAINDVVTSYFTNLHGSGEITKRHLLRVTKDRQLGTGMIAYVMKRHVA